MWVGGAVGSLAGGGANVWDILQRTAKCWSVGPGDQAARGTREAAREADQWGQDCLRGVLRKGGADVDLKGCTQVGRKKDITGRRRNQEKAKKKNQMRT